MRTQDLRWKRLKTPKEGDSNVRTGGVRGTSPLGLPRVGISLFTRPLSPFLKKNIPHVILQSMPRSPARRVPKGFDPDDLEVGEEIRACRVCGSAFFVDTLKISDKRRGYCKDKCKEQGTIIRAYLSRNNYNLDVAEYVSNPQDFLPVNPNLHAKHKPLAERIPDLLTRNVLHHILRKERGIKTKMEIERTKQARSKRMTEEIKSQTAMLYRSHVLIEEEQRKNIKEAVVKLGLVPLSANPDIMSGKKVMISEEEVANIRTNISIVVNEHIVMIDQVLRGELVWSTQQVTLFTKLLSKVVPDASSSKIGSPHDKPMGELSVAELEKLIRDSHPKPVAEVKDHASQKS